MEAIVQLFQVWVTVPSSSKASGKSRAWKAHPVTVSEYVKSWMHNKTWITGKRSRNNGNSTQLKCLTAVIAMKARQAHQDEAARFDTDAKAIRIDNCASYCISNDKRDFITPLKRINKKLKGLGGTLTEVYSGTIKWSIEDDDGVPHDIVIPNGLYVKDSPSKLLSPQHWAQTAQDFKPLPRGTWCSTYHDCIQLHWAQRKHTKTVRLNEGSGNIATMYTAPSYKAFTTFCSMCEVEVDEDDPIINMETHLIPDHENEDIDGPVHQPEAPDTSSQGVYWTQAPNTPVSFDLDAIDRTDLPAIIEDEEDTAFHEKPAAEFLRWHHKLNHMSGAKMQSMAKRGLLPKILAKCQIPACTSCLYGKATRRPWRTKPKVGHQGGKLRTATEPGQCISVDQLESTTPGLIAQIKGWLTKKRYRVATIFVDHFSGLSYIHLQKSTNAEETLEAKLAFERYASKFKVQVKSYQADNGRFAENKFMTAVKDSGQTITFCGVNAHFQNAVAERRIRTLQDQARTMLIHAQHRWPKAIDAHLWPYALRVANEVHNSTPTIGRQDLKSPFELFAKSEIMPNLNHFQPFGCPVFVLDNKMQSGKKLPKWEVRSRMGINLGMSTQHARSVALVLNLKTGHVSPQFHVSFDSKFETVRGSLGNLSPPSEWQKMCGFTSSSTVKRQVNQGQPLQAEESQPFMEFDLEPGLQVKEGEWQASQTPLPESEGDEPDDEPPPLRRSPRLNKIPEKLPVKQSNVSEVLYGMEAKLEDKLPYHVAYEAIKEWADIEGQEQHPMLAYAASADPDTMYYHEAMREPDRPEFIKAMEKEVKSHTENGVWELVPRSSVPPGTKILPAVWAMKRKRRIATREIYKWKARLNIDGSKQEEGVNYWETFSPVASWAAIRMVLITVLILAWFTKQIDFVLAYTQADVECELYMAIPKGFEVEGDYVLKLKKNLFGQKQAGRVWNQHLVTKLKEIGFIPSQIDECLFFKGKSIFVLYTDDSILAGPDNQELEDIIQEMKSVGLNLTVEGDISDFLGVQIDRVNSSTFNLSQPHLITDVIKELRLDGQNVTIKKTTGASSKTLGRHLDAPPFDDHFNYRRVIGQMNYLEKCSRLDISCAVHQGARFVSNPRFQHGKALKWLGRYLVGSRDKGMIYTPSNQSFDVYVDASFTGDWDPENADWDPDTARSRTGYVILYASCPVIWASKLQSEIALSTTESEYLAISTATREVLPLMELIQEMKDHGCGLTATNPQLHCRVFEDNTGAVELASSVKNPKMRPRTRHINTKYHHFRNKVQDGTISIHPISTEDMLADILTKVCNESIHIKLRKQLMGW
jgi:Reverse transcriptase (RNA-dependent DNA polymerase)/GAG-pre-integrase domain